MVNDNPTPMDEKHDISDISPECMAEMREDCQAFVNANMADLLAFKTACLNGERISYDPSRGMPEDYAGHDYWLTRNRHGAGFWDRGLGELGERLSAAARADGEVDLYVGDDGRIYC